MACCSTAVKRKLRNQEVVGLNPTKAAGPYLSPLSVSTVLQLVLRLVVVLRNFLKRLSFGAWGKPSLMRKEVAKKVRSRKAFLSFPEEA